MEKSEDQAYRKILIELRKDQAGRFDTLLTTLASGALGATFFYGKDTLSTLNWFSFSVWAATCLIFSLSLWTVLQSFSIPLKQINKTLNLKKIDKGAVERETKESNKKIQKFRNRGVVLLFTGVFLLFCFTLLNFIQ